MLAHCENYFLSNSLILVRNRGQNSIAFADKHIWGFTRILLCCTHEASKTLQRLVIFLFMSRCHWRRVIAHVGSTTRHYGCQVPRPSICTATEMLRTNGQQAPNLLLRMRGQDETSEIAHSRHQRANSSGSDLCAKKFPLMRDMGSAWEVLSLNQHCVSNFIYVCR